jgi:hypothetical protein
MSIIKDKLMDVIREYRSITHEMMMNMESGNDCYIISEKYIENLEELNKKSLDILLECDNE